MLRKLFEYRSLSGILVFGTIILGARMAFSDLQNGPIVVESDGRCLVVTCITQNPVDPDPLNPTAHPCNEYGGSYCHFPEGTNGNLVFCKDPAQPPYKLCSIVISPIVFNSCIGRCIRNNKHIMCRDRTR